jgi:phosphoribosylamine--glycine ligase
VPPDARLPDWAFAHPIDLVVASGPHHWVETFVDLHLPTLGPTEAAQGALAGRQALRQILGRAGLHGAEGETFSELDMAERYVASRPLPLWVRSESGPWHEAMLVRDRHTAFLEVARVFRQAGGSAVSVERAYAGRPVSFALLTDGSEAIPFGVARIALHRGDSDTGPLTEGMGAWASWEHAQLEARLFEEVGRPLLATLRAEGLLRPGFLQLRLTLTAERAVVDDLVWGLDDLHAAALLPLWEGELAPLLRAAAQGRMEGGPPRWRRAYTVAVALVSAGYPARPQTGQPVYGLEEVEALVFHQATCLRPAHAGSLWSAPFATRRREESAPCEVVAEAGRVLFAVGTGRDLQQARAQAMAALREIRCAHAAWRNDIGGETS